MRQLMRQHRGQLVCAGGHRHQTEVDPDVAAGQCKRVHRLVAHQERLPGVAVFQIGADLATLARGAQQLAPQRLQVLQHQRVVDHRRVTANGPHDAITQSTLGTGREVLPHRIPQGRQGQGRVRCVGGLGVRLHAHRPGPAGHDQRPPPTGAGRACRRTRDGRGDGLTAGAANQRGKQGHGHKNRTGRCSMLRSHGLESTRLSQSSHS